MPGQVQIWLGNYQESRLADAQAPAESRRVEQRNLPRLLDPQLVGTQQMTIMSGVDNRHRPLARVVQQCGIGPRAEELEMK